LGRKPEGKRWLWRPSGSCEGTDWINLGQNMHKWQVVGNMEMNTLWTRPVPSLPPNSHLTLSGLHLSWSISQYMAGKQLQYVAKSQPSPPGYRHLLTLIPSTLGYNPQCSSGTNAQMSMVTMQRSGVYHLLHVPCIRCSPVCTICYVCAMHTLQSGVYHLLHTCHVYTAVWYVPSATHVPHIH
jgi:hypothetical protein